LTIPAPDFQPSSRIGASILTDGAAAAAGEPSAQQPTIDHICGAFHGFMRALHALDRPGWGDLNLTMSQLKTIMLLVDSNGLSGRDLADRLGVGASAVTALVDRLVQRGYVRREEDRSDRRVSWARPTEKATRLFERLHATHRERLADILRDLSDDQLALVAQAISTLELAATKQAGIAPTPRAGKIC
jgi:DNA-binding MarR family transcriptional regulator